MIEIPEHLSKPVGTSGPRLLEIERSKASFDVEGLKSYLHGQEHLDRVKRILPVLENEVRRCSRCTPLDATLLPGSASFRDRKASGRGGAVDVRLLTRYSFRTPTARL